MSGLGVGNAAPDFSLFEALGDDAVTLSGHRGEPVVVLFVPLAFSGVCTKELCHVGRTGMCGDRWARASTGSASIPPS